MSGGRTGRVLVGGVRDVEDVVELHVDAGRRVEGDPGAVGTVARELPELAGEGGGVRPAAYTSTRSGTPESGSSHRSAWSMLERSEAGTTPQPRRAHSRHAPRRARVARRRRSTPRSSRSASTGRHQVGGPGQPDVGVPAQRGVEVLVVPAQGRPALVHEVGLAGEQELVDPPVVVVLPPRPHPGVLAEQCADVAEPVGVGQLEGPVGLDEPRPRVSLRGAGLRQQPAGAHVAVCGRQQAQRDRRADQQQRPGRDQAPAPEGGHDFDGTSGSGPVEPSTDEASLRPRRAPGTTRRPPARQQGPRRAQRLVAQGVAVGARRPPCRCG